MSAGLIVGYLQMPKGVKFEGDGEVKLRAIYGDTGQIGFIGEQGKGQARTETDGNGKFALPFAWDASGFAAGTMNITVHLFCSTEKVTKVGRVTTTYVLGTAAVKTRGYLFPNIAGRMGVAFPDLQSNAGLASFAKDLLEASRKIKAVPVPNMGWTSAEGWLILGGTLVQLT